VATEPAPQRAYRAACPNCGAPVEFRSAASPFAVCSFCRSVVVRDGAALRKVGESAELFDDHSPLALGTTGRWQGAPFALVGRVQWGAAQTRWTEWHALFDPPADGSAPARSGWLSEDNGRYVLGFDAPLPPGAAPRVEHLVVGAPLTVAGRRWSVASIVEASPLAAEGELPKRPRLGATVPLVDVRSPTDDAVGTLEYGDPAAPTWSEGRSVELAALGLSGLAEPSEKSLSGRAFTCPSCGFTLEPKLASTQSIVCPQCSAVVDLSAGVGADLAHYRQAKATVGPPIPLGATGTFGFGAATPLPWTAVGWSERNTVPGPGDDGEVFTWREVLLYNRTAGFAFLVDSADGWSWAVPATGAPEGSGDRVAFQGVSYRRQETYDSVVHHVEGEFYWRLARGERTAHADYRGSGAASDARLNREETRRGNDAEVTWSAGRTLSAESVRSAFGLPATAIARDASPTSTDKTSLLVKIVVGFFLLSLVLSFVRCGSGPSAADCSEMRDTFGEASREYQNCVSSRRSSGGSYGGFSTGGGGHK
jgi:hypothetical protein